MHRYKYHTTQVTAPPPGVVVVTTKGEEQH